MVIGAFLSLIAFLGSSLIVSEYKRKKAEDGKRDAEIDRDSFKEEIRINNTDLDDLIDEHNRERK